MEAVAVLLSLAIFILFIVNFMLQREIDDMRKHHLEHLKITYEDISIQSDIIKIIDAQNKILGTIMDHLTPKEE